MPRDRNHLTPQAEPRGRSNVSGTPLRSHELPDPASHAASQGLVVHKFGGTSLENAERIESVAGLIGLGS